MVKSGSAALIDTAELRRLARRYRAHVAMARVSDAPLSESGYVMVYEGIAVGWSEKPDPADWCPGVFAVPARSNVLVAEGGNPDSGAKSWRPIL